MNRFVTLLCGVLAYAGFLAAFLYLTAFMAGTAVPKGIDSGQAGSLGWAMLINAMLVGLFGLQHAVMARDTFKERWTRIVPEPLERSGFVLAASLVLALLFWQWQPIPALVWDVESEWLRTAIWCLFATGIATVLYTSFLIDHFDLFGLRQVWLQFRGRPYTPVPFSVRSLYKLVRHPMMIGFLLTFYCVPTMT
ncbi:MAG: isoprenylcysteine carboxylmethyltransferase family protein, partial [Planctomycetes bacterium]|nr:isoprenylcysteine carboxylmethyltransferase family protein [Planctomycetota bacterium]